MGGLSIYEQVFCVLGAGELLALEALLPWNCNHLRLFFQQPLF